MTTIHPGLWGRPFLDLEADVDATQLDEIDHEIAYGLTQVPLEYTGGSHRSMGITPASNPDAHYVDYGEIIRGFTPEAFATFVSLADEPGSFDVRKHGAYGFGEEQEHPLSRKQMLYLKFRYGVYFPWQVFYEMIPTLDWADKSHGDGKAFTAEARRYFPRTVAFVRSLPFAQIGRCNLLGLDANHDGTIHQDGDLDDANADHFITVCPRGNKRLFLWDDATRSKTFVDARVYWFNDHGYHGVEAAPYFRYSLRVDGVFKPEFLASLRARCGV